MTGSYYTISDKSAIIFEDTGASGTESNGIDRNKLIVIVPDKNTGDINISIISGSESWNAFCGVLYELK